MQGKSVKPKDLSLVAYREILASASEAQVALLARRGCDVTGLAQIGSFCQLHSVEVGSVVEWFEVTRGTMQDFDALVRLHCGPDELDFVSYLARTHGTRPRTLIRWMQETGASLEQTGDATELRDNYERATGIAILKVLVELNLQDMPSLEQFMAPFEDVMEISGDEFPLHHLIHVVEEQLDGDWHKAHQWANENPRGFAELLAGRLDPVGFGLQYLVRQHDGDEDLDLEDEGDD